VVTAEQPGRTVDKVSWLRDFGPLVVTWMAVQVLLMCMFGMWAGWHGWQRRLGARVTGLARPVRPAPLVPLGRPVEQVAADLRRLRVAFARDGLRWAKWEGTRLAYDAALAEGADVLQIPHLMAILPPSVERDTERMRVERLLEDAGLLLDDRAA
jgi:hypothetical protein